MPVKSKKLPKYAVRFIPKSGYTRRSVGIRGNNLEKLLRRVQRQLDKKTGHPWEYIHVLTWNEANLDSETVLFFKLPTK